jgi:iron-sulfur cluster assembly accessory protein
MSGIILTERAATEVKDLLRESEEPLLYLRLKIVGGGCSGFSTKLDLDSVFSEDKDVLFEQQGVKIVVDKRSMLYAEGATIDWHEDLNKRGFSITMVGTKGTCGCGSSFSM